MIAHSQPPYRRLTRNISFSFPANRPAMLYAAHHITPTHLSSKRASGVFSPGFLSHFPLSRTGM